MGSWNHMEHTGNTIIKDFIRQMWVPLENSAYFGDGDGINWNPDLIHCGQMMPYVISELGQH